MKLGIDCDETLSELMDGFLKWHKERYGHAPVREKVRDYYSVFGSLDTGFQFFEEFCRSQRLGELTTVPGSQDAIADLAKQHELHIITARPDYAIPTTKEWVVRHYGNVFKDIHFITGNNKGHSKLRKSTICQKVGIELVVDDMMHQAFDCATPRRTVLLLDKPWNQEPTNGKNIIRCRDWTDVHNYIKAK